MKREVVLSGRGMVSSLGVGVERNWERVASGESGLGCSVTLGETVSAGLLARCDFASGAERLFDLAESAYREAVRDAGLDDEALAGSAVIFAHGCPPSALIVDGARRLGSGRRARPDTVYRTMENHVASRLADGAGVAGPVISNSAACCGSAQSIYLGYCLVSGGFRDVCVCGGADVVDEFTYHAFESMRVVLAHGASLSEKSIRPYGFERCGIALGEGAGFVVLESAESAERRGVRALARIDNALQANDGNARFGDVSESRLWCELFERTTEGVSIDHVMGHGTSTVLGDEVEASAIARCFGDCPVASTKYLLGHTLAASTVLDVVLLSVALARQRVIGSGQHYRVDPALEAMDLVSTSREHAFDTALKVSAGFGGAMNCIVMSKA